MRGARIGGRKGLTYDSCWCLEPGPSEPPLTISLFPGSVKGRLYSFLLNTLKNVGSRGGISNLKLCKPCKFQSITDFLIAHLIFVFLSPPSPDQYWSSNASVSLKKELNLLLVWPHMGEWVEKILLLGYQRLSLYIMGLNETEAKITIFQPDPHRAKLSKTSSRP